MTVTIRRAEPEKTKGPSAERYARQRLPEVVDELRRLNGELKDLVRSRKTPELPQPERTKTNNRWHYVRGRLDALRKEQAELREVLSRSQATPKA